MELTQFDPKLQSWVFLAFYVGFGILAGIWPLHTWSPDGHASAPTAVSMLHAGVLMKLGAYGVVRLGMGLLPDGTLQWSWLVGTIACVNIVYGALSAMAQTDLKYVIAYSSVSHMGVVMLGAATLTEVGLNGSVFQMFAHGIMTGLFFALVGLVYEKAHSREIFKMGGFGPHDARHRDRVHHRRSLVAGAARHRGLRGRVPHVPGRLAVVARVVALPRRWSGPISPRSTCCASPSRSSGARPSADPHFQHLPDARGPEWAALWILVGDDRALRGVAVAGPGAGGHRHHPAPEPSVGAPVNGPEAGSPLVLEVGLALLMLAVFLVGLFMSGDDKRRVGVLTAIGLVVLFGFSWRTEAGAELFHGTFVQDELALFAKRLFLLATLIGVLASLPLRAATFARRATEYYLAILASLLGMLVLASARDLVLLFVAFELMSIPLYYLAGFLKREPEAVEAALKFFLIGTVSSAVLAYGLSFMYGVAGTTDVRGVAHALGDRPSHDAARHAAGAGRARLQDRRVPVPHVGARHLRGGEHALRGVALGGAQGGGLRGDLPPLPRGHGRPACVYWVPVAAALATVTIIGGNLMAIPQQNIKRLLAYSGVAHIGYMLVGFAAVSANGIAMMLFYLVAYLFGNMGAFLVVEAVAQSEGSDAIAAYRGLAQRSPILALCMLLFLLSLGGIPFVAGLLGEALRLLGRRRAGALLAGAGGRGADRGGPVLLPAGRQAHVHRRARAPRADPGGPAPSVLHLPLRDGRGGHGDLSEAAGRRRPARRRPPVLDPRNCRAILRGPCPPWPSASFRPSSSSACSASSRRPTPAW